MEKKIVLDTATGRTERFPILRLAKAVFHSPQQRKVAIKYVQLMFRAILLGKKAQHDDQLLRDIAWTKAHLYVLDCFARRAAKDCPLDAFYQSYDAILLHWPVPTIL